MRKSKLVLDRNVVFSGKGITVYKEKNGTYFFESNTSNLSNFITNDFLEAASALVKIREANDSRDLWEIPVTKQMMNSINISKSIYWITGGDREWKSTNSIYRGTWDEYQSVFEHKLTPMVKNYMHNFKTLGDVRTYLLNNMNLPFIYELSLELNMIK